MRELLLVGSGSFLGGMTRYFLSGMALAIFPASRFPLGTFCVNLIGCLVIGLIAGLFELQAMNYYWRLFLVTGVLGGFTTFSAFGYETISLAKDGNLDMSVLNVAASVGICLLAVWLGMKIGQSVVAG